MSITIGVLGLQGDFQKHVEMLEQIEGVETVVVRMPEALEECSGLIIPGGESTTLGKLMERYGVDKAIRRRHSEGMAIFGTCAGMIMLATDIEGSDQQRLGLLDITVRRNAFGRQIDSFEEDLVIPCVCDNPLRAVFIRAPFVTRVGKDVQTLAALPTGEAIMVRRGHIIAASFHPELTDDTRVHKYFVGLAGEKN